MDSGISNLDSKIFLGLMLFLQFTLNTMILLDIPIARQILGFIYLTFLPGFVIIKLLRLNELNMSEIILFSIGFSIAFLMLIGFFVNELAVLFKLSQPLSLIPLLIILNISILLSVFYLFLRNENIRLRCTRTFRLHPSLLILASLPILAVIGAMWVNRFNNNLILLLMIIVISVLFISAVISEKLIPAKLYSFVLFIIAISLLYHSSLISNYIVCFGSDVPIEHFVFKNTQNSAYWNLTTSFFEGLDISRIHSMLSVTILPTIYSSLLNVNSTWVFKAIYPAIFSFVPLGLYQVWAKYVKEKYAFISAFLFMAYAAFYNELLGLNRQIIAELFFCLLLLLILNKKRQPNRIMCFFLFSFGLVTSHYGLSEIFLFFISLTFVSLILVKRPSKNVTLSMVVYFFVIMFTWYIYTSSSGVFNSLLEFGNYVYSQLGEFFNPASRGQTVLRGLGLESPPTIWNAISRIFAYATEFLIAIGFIGLITNNVKVHVDREFRILCTIAITFLAALIIVPGLAETMRMTRFYHILLFVLAPLCVIGAEVLVKLVSKRRKELIVCILLLIILVPYFLFQTGLIYEITGSESWSISLSGYRMGPRLYTSFGFATKQEVFGAQWLSRYASADVEHLRVHVDAYSRTSLIIYGMIPRSSMSSLSNVTVVEENEFVYFGKLNIFYGVVMEETNVWNTTNIMDSALSKVSKVYSNGDCEVYTNTLDY